MVLRQYPSPFLQATVHPLGNRGGFSGAGLFRVESPLGPLCLRAWPTGFQGDQLAFIHLLMNRAHRAGLSFVPAVYSCVDSSTFVSHTDRLWELTGWMPGRADFQQAPSTARLEAAAHALARLHATWAVAVAPTAGVCPAVRRRLDLLTEWQSLVRAGWRPLEAADRNDPVYPVARRAWDLLPGRVAAVPRILSPWVARHWPLQPCLCDPWHDHFLFEGERLTGLVDYGSAKLDHVAVDLGRTLGSLVPGDRSGWETALTVYRREKPLTAEEERLAHDLDETGLILGIANWLTRLYRSTIQVENRGNTARRLEVLVRRLEGMERGESGVSGGVGFFLRHEPT